MIESLSISNFQAHKKLKLDLDSNCTTIIGPSDVGKSSVLRALRWVAQNTPRGKDIIRWGEKNEAKVVLSEEDCCITRRRSASINEYKLTTDGGGAVIGDEGDGVQVFKAFGDSVPEDVAKILKLSDLNFQGQFDPIFWLSSSSGEVSRQLNSLVALDLIDEAFAYLGQRTSQLRAELKVAEEDFKEASTKVESLEFMDDVDEVLKILEANEECNEKLQRDIATLVDVGKRIGASQSRIQQAETGLGALEELIEIADKVRRLHDSWHELNTLAESIDLKLILVSGGQQCCEEGLKLCEDYLNLQIAGAKVRDLEALVGSVKSKSRVAKWQLPLMRCEELLWDANDLKTLEKDLDRLIELGVRLKDDNDRISAHVADLDRYKKTFDDMMGTACPLCGQALGG